MPYRGAVEIILRRKFIGTRGAFPECEIIGMRTVELRISDDELSPAMDRMRIWLDDNKVSASSFRFDRENDVKVVVVLSFASDAEADAFANAFGGKLQ